MPLTCYRLLHFLGHPVHGLGHQRHLCCHPYGNSCPSPVSMLSWFCQSLHSLGHDSLCSAVQPIIESREVLLSVFRHMTGRASNKSQAPPVDSSFDKPVKTVEVTPADDDTAHNQSKYHV